MLVEGRGPLISVGAGTITAEVTGGAVGPPGREGVQRRLGLVVVADRGLRYSSGAGRPHEQLSTAAGRRGGTGAPLGSQDGSLGRGRLATLAVLWRLLALWLSRHGYILFAAQAEAVMQRNMEVFVATVVHQDDDQHAWGGGRTERSCRLPVYGAAGTIGALSKHECG
jgi:hypothetical protein